MNNDFEAKIDSLFLQHAEVCKAKTAMNWSAKDFEACQALIEKTGSLRHILTKPQRAYYDAFKSGNHEEYSLLSTRKIGKSFSNCIIAYEYAMNHPNVTVLIVLPELKQAKEIYYPIFQEMEKYLPGTLRPRIKISEAKAVFRNGSIIKLGGAKPENIESLRGPACHLFIGDEIGFFDANNFWNAINNIIKPQMTLTEGKSLYSTTPPESPDHPFVAQIYPKLLANGTCMTFTVFDNPLLSSVRIRQIAENCGGFDSITFRREYLAELIADDSLRVVPECTPARHFTSEMPAQTDMFGNECSDWITYQVVDLGLVDFTGRLGAYYDHFRDKLVVFQESMFDGTTPGFGLEYVVDDWNSGLATLNEICPSREPVCVVDGFDQVTFELRQKYSLRFNRPKKGKVEETIAMLRNAFQVDKILVVGCPQLRYQLMNGVWHENRKDFLRTPTAGHLDLLMCLAYMVREVRWGKAPGQDDLNKMRIGLNANKFINRRIRGTL